MWQVYKTQLGNAAIHRSDEKRLFADDKLFGLASLLQHNEGSSRTAEILQKSSKQYEIVRNEVAETSNSRGGLLEAIFQRDFDALNEQMLHHEQEQEVVVAGEDSLAGVVFSHSTAKLVGDNVEEKMLKTYMAQHLQESERVQQSGKTVAEQKREQDPEAFRRQRESFMQPRRAQAASIPLVKK